MMKEGIYFVITASLLVLAGAAMTSGQDFLYWLLLAAGTALHVWKFEFKENNRNDKRNNYDTL